MLGTIITNKKIKNKIGFVNVVNDMSVVDDLTKPILIIGYYEAKKLFPRISILDKKIKENLFWTYGKTEKRDEYEHDIKKFYEYVINISVNKLKYYYINILTIKYSKIKKLINILNNANKKYIYINNKMIYIYYDNYVIGLYLEMFDWVNVSKQKVLSKITNCNNAIIYENDSFLDLMIKRIINNKKYATPYFMYLQDMKT